MSAELAIDLTIDASAWSDRVADAEEIVLRAARAAYLNAGSDQAAELSLVLADDRRVRDLNREWRGKDSPTNVLSFPTEDKGAPGRARHLGDVVLALETVLGEAERFGKPVGHHVAHLTVHGVLHLLGFDHQAPAEAVKMERLEAQILGGLGVADPYESDDRVQH